MAGVLHLMCGKIAAGKSTRAAKLAEAPNSVLIGEDQLFARLYRLYRHSVEGLPLDGGGLGGGGVSGKGSAFH